MKINVNGILTVYLIALITIDIISRSIGQSTAQNSSCGSYSNPCYIQTKSSDEINVVNSGSKPLFIKNNTSDSITVKNRSDESIFITNKYDDSLYIKTHPLEEIDVRVRK